jgi:hypothetical protein
MKQQNGFIDPVYATVAAGTILLLGLIFVGGPQYNVWQQSLADAEIIRATGVAKANQIIGDSLKDNREYLQYLYITGLEDGSKNGNVTIYVPTEGGLPVPTLSYDRK